MMTVTGDKALIAKFDKAAAALKASEREWLWEAGGIVEAAIEANIMAQGLFDENADRDFSQDHLVDTGRVFAPTAHTVTVGFGQGIDYAPALELGAVPHQISAVNYPNLIFSAAWAEGGMFIGPFVNHPGNRPYRFMRTGTEAAFVPVCLMFAKRLDAIFGTAVL